MFKEPFSNFSEVATSNGCRLRPLARRWWRSWSSISPTLPSLLTTSGSMVRYDFGIVISLNCCYISMWPFHGLIVCLYISNNYDHGCTVGLLHSKMNLYFNLRTVKMYFSFFKVYIANTLL